MNTSRGSGITSSAIARNTRVFTYAVDRAVGRGIGAAPRHGPGQGPEAAEVVVEDLLFHQPVQHQLQHAVGVASTVFSIQYSAFRAVDSPAICASTGSSRSSPVSVASRSVSDSRSVSIRSSSAKIGEHGAGKDAGQVPALYLLQVAALLVQKHENRLFSQSHELLPFAAPDPDSFLIEPT